MSIMQDPVPTLDPSSQQEFAERGREAAPKGKGRSRSRKLVVWPPFVSKAKAPVPEAAMAGASGMRTDGGLALKPCRSTT